RKRLTEHLRPRAAQSREPYFAGTTMPRRPWFEARQIDLVPHDDPRQRSGKARGDRGVGRVIRLARIGDDQRQVRTRDRGKRPFDPDLFERVDGRPHSGGVDVSERDATNLDAVEHRIVSGLVHWRYVRDIFVVVL